MTNKREGLTALAVMRPFLWKIAFSTLTLLSLSPSALSCSPTHCSPLGAADNLSVYLHHSPQKDVEVRDERPTAQPVPIPETGLSLVPPPGFTLATQYSGFENLEDLSSILAVELPSSAHAELSALFTSTPEALTEAFAERGLVLEVESLSAISLPTSSSEDIEIPFAIGTQTLGELKVKKYFALLGEGRTVLLTFNIMPNSPLREADIENTLQSVKISPLPTRQDDVTTLPFTFEVVSPFRRAFDLLGSTVLLNLSGELETAPETAPESVSEEPIIIIASSLSPTAINLPSTALADFSEQLLKDTDGFADVTIRSRSPVTFAGGAGYAIEATSQDGLNFAITQYVRVLPDGHYIRMLVVGASEELTELSPAIQAIQSSVLPR